MGRRGELRIYFGSAPGVGKTYAMLGEGRRRADRGTDVVVGFVETHGRARTAARLDGLETVPRRRLVHRGTELTELDVDAVLARAPQVALIDELAHTNVPGSKHPKRWQDVEELLEAGITVLSTVNVQHLESLNDVVERITGVRQKETVPDEVVRRAEQVELVDITPEALRRRMVHGNIYGPEKVEAALANYFRPGNLIALRELALLWVAEEVDLALLRYRTDRQIGEVWETRERVVVAVTGGPESETVLRRAARLAMRFGSADLMCVHVLRADGLPGGPVSALAGLRRLAEDLGASFHTVVGDDVTTALLDFAQGANATQLVIGTSRRSRLARVFAEGIGARVVRAAGPIDVHMVNHDDAGQGLRLRVRRGTLSPHRRLAAWAAGLVLPALATAAGMLAPGTIALPTDVVLFFLATIAVALIGGLGPALLAAVVGGLLLNFFLIPPLHNFGVAYQEHVITLVAMVIVAVIVALLVDRTAHRAEQAARARTEAALLTSFSRTVLTPDNPLPRLLGTVREAFGLTSVAIVERAQDGHWVTTACAGPNNCDRPEDAEVDVELEPDIHLVGTGRSLAAADRGLLETMGGQSLLALRNQRIAAEAADSKRRAESSAVPTPLLSAIGHDLRTPLTSIKAAVTCLRDPQLDLSESDSAELGAAIEESTDRLIGLISNVLDSSRLAAGAVFPQLAAVGYDEVAAHAIDALPEAHAVDVEIDEFMPEVLADAGLLERVIANVVDNALRHGRGAPVAIRGRALADRVELRIVDSGPGVPPATRVALFTRRFTPYRRRRNRNATSGVGLGLTVARGFTEAMGGTIYAEDTPGGGLTVVIALPAARQVTQVPQ
ncbi:DUF4118 domain-containing protein [Pseudonocardia aurantiaca]|uniref:histidine kinase n=1 Tax=Pseudonocardia aurantiaca TaxID=75290 RepID=A0ABW4FQH1_9PSEU